jgi:hypothetical protein
MQETKKQARNTSFERILELCHRRIRTVARYGGMNTVYDVPGILIGYPLYNIHECCQYITRALRQDGFLVQLSPPASTIYVSWDPAELARMQIRPPLHAPSRGPPPLINLERLAPPPMELPAPRR